MSKVRLAQRSASCDRGRSRWSSGQPADRPDPDALARHVGHARGHDHLDVVRLEVPDHLAHRVAGSSNAPPATKHDVGLVGADQGRGLVRPRRAPRTPPAVATVESDAGVTRADDVVPEPGLAAEDRGDGVDVVGAAHDHGALPEARRAGGRGAASRGAGSDPRSAAADRSGTRRGRSRGRARTGSGSSRCRGSPRRPRLEPTTILYSSAPAPNTPSVVAAPEGDDQDPGQHERETDQRRGLRRPRRCPGGSRGCGHRQRRTRSPSRR